MSPNTKISVWCTAGERAPTFCRQLVYHVLYNLCLEFKALAVAPGVAGKLVVNRRSNKDLLAS